MNERVLILEHTLEHVNSRLNEGAKTFTRIDEILRPSIAKVIAWVASFVAASGIPIALFLIKLGRYPDAEEFVRAQAEYRATLEATEKRVQSLEVSRAEQEIRLRTILQSLERLESKLDSALQRRK